MTTAAKPKPNASIRVRGVTHRNPDEARVYADELEHHADELAGELRRNGKDGEADTVQDRGHADAEKLRSWARDREAGEAEATEQPPDRPTAKPSRRRRPSVTPRTRATVRGIASGGGSALRATGIPQSTSAFLIQVAGLSIAIAFLTLLLTPRGVKAFGGLADAGANGLAWFLAPTDPLATHKSTTNGASGFAAAAAAAAAYARSGAATRRATAPGAHR